MPSLVTPAVLVREKKILVCAGPGGVGKTTTAAAIAALGARHGRRTLVATIDPAPRLADALGVPDLGGEPRALSPEASAALGIAAPGSLHAVRLDTARAFRRLVEDQISDPEMRRRIFDNAIYRQITSTLTGSQEYAATLALYDLHRSGDWDLLVLDTPPTAHALDFLEAPRRIADAVASPLVQWFARPKQPARFLSWERLRAGPALVLRRLGKFVGSQFLDDLGVFLLDFRDVLDGFLARAQAVEALLRRPETAFLLVMAPELPSVNEALYFAGRLRAAGLPLSGFVANRVAPRPGSTEPEELRGKLAAVPALQRLDRQELAIAADSLAEVARYLGGVATDQARQLARLAHDAPEVPVTRVPLLTHDVSSLASLRTVGDHLGATA